MQHTYQMLSLFLLWKWFVSLLIYFATGLSTGVTEYFSEASSLSAPAKINSLFEIHRLIKERWYPLISSGLLLYEQLARKVLFLSKIKLVSELNFFFHSFLGVNELFIFKIQRSLVQRRRLYWKLCKLDSSGKIVCNACNFEFNVHMSCRGFICPSDRRIQNLARILQAILEGNAYYLQAACKILARFESSCKKLARFWIQLASILQDYEFILQVSCKILNSSIFFTWFAGCTRRLTDLK